MNLTGMFFQELNGNVWEILLKESNGKYCCVCHTGLYPNIYLFESELEYQTNQKQIKWINNSYKNGGPIQQISSPFLTITFSPPPMPSGTFTYRISDLNTHSDITLNSMKNTVMTLQQLKKQCNHKWIKYQGFTDVYQYCEHCDEKKK